MRLLQLLPVFLGLAAAAPASSLLAHPGAASDGGRQPSAPRFPGHDLAAGAVAATVLHKRTAPGMSRMVQGIQRYWAGAAGAGYRKLRGEWNAWDKNACWKRNYPRLQKAQQEANPEFHPGFLVHPELFDICRSRQTAEAYDKRHQIGSRANSRPQEPAVNPDPPKGVMKFERQVDRASHRLVKGLASWQRAAALDQRGAGSLERGAARAETFPVLKYAAHE
ncbi:MAG: hypothetical protein M1826_004681 [Phylliscum demangeonii]|nr:MAG: hypothetical protein M1826_004681 [Phylliscum demangeonii]